MANEETMRLVKPYAKGQVTILKMVLKGSSIEITPLRVVDEDQLSRDYDGSEIEAFLEEDKIDPGTANRVRDLLAG
jgi:hypothetical protein